MPSSRGYPERDIHAGRLRRERDVADGCFESTHRDGELVTAGGEPGEPIGAGLSVVVIESSLPPEPSVTVAPGMTPAPSRTVPESASCCAALSDANARRTIRQTNVARSVAVILHTSRFRNEGGQNQYYSRQEAARAGPLELGSLRRHGWAWRPSTRRRGRAAEIGVPRRRRDGR